MLLDSNLIKDVEQVGDVKSLCNFSFSWYTKHVQL